MCAQCVMQEALTEHVSDCIGHTELTIKQYSASLKQNERMWTHGYGLNDQWGKKEQ